MKLPWRPVAILLAAALAGCATPPPEPVQQQSLSGRLSLRVERPGEAPRSMAANFELEGDAQRGRLLLDTPIGTRVAEARWAPDGAWLKSERGTESFADLDALATGTLGEPVPLAALPDWLRGRPWAGAPVATGATESLFVQRHGQQDWQVSLLERAAGWVLITRVPPPAVSLRIKLDEH
ncbi:lipoprotein insertase outer membrane protein LolB [Rivibacter subsaxonicus]|uniref:Outer-membrane lipoprotein LolB n=1 Tax=Rivibacter subsaxonicus TaxID=457575 RepID=A0A4Q7VGA3_9BURK|nr:lipoprotein insertase outer membrane protein LolB [Rivibacter subsaxonicus]RZT95052.1 outer membrane lipoprotein LolB [Rivibacter subsaxonicus]